MPSMKKCKMPPRVLAEAIAIDKRKQLDFKREVHGFIDDIVRHCEDPSMWPLTQTEQIAFVRTVIYKARILQRRETYVAECVEMAAEDLSLAS